MSNAVSILNIAPTTLSIPCAPTGMGKRASARLWKSWKVLGLSCSLKTPSPKSVWTVTTLLFREERPWMIVQRWLFHYYKRILCCCARILKENEERTPDASPKFGIVKPMLIVPRFYHIHRSGAKIVAAGGQLEVKNCTKISCPRPLYLVGRGPSQRTPPCLAIRISDSPSPGKIPAGAHGRYWNVSAILDNSKLTSLLINDNDYY